MSISQDVSLLEKLVKIIRRVSCATVTPHASVLHKTYTDLEAIADSRSASYCNCPEAEWLGVTLKATESAEKRKKQAGALSVMQFRGTGMYWEILWKHVKRRIAEKCQCAVRDLQVLRHDHTSSARAQQSQRLGVLARLVALDEDIAVGFVKNGFDALNKEFVRCPDLDAAQRFLQGIGAPLHSVPLPIRQRVAGMRLMV